MSWPVVSPILLTLLLVGADVVGPIDCGQAFALRNDLARQESELLRVEVERGRLTSAERERLVAVRKRRRQLLVCG